MNDEYYLVTITEINGDYEYDSKIFLVVGKDETATDVLDQHLLDLGGEYDEENGYWSRHDGTGYRCDYTPRKLSKQHYDILRQY